MEREHRCRWVGLVAMVLPGTAELDAEARPTCFEAAPIVPPPQPVTVAEEQVDLVTATQRAAQQRMKAFALGTAQLEAVTAG